jgi:predicted neuraminidase
MPLPRPFFWFAATLAVLVVSPCLHAGPRLSLREDLQYQPGIVSAEFLYDKASFPSCHASTIAETERGLIAAFFGGTHEKHPDVGIWVCRKDRGMAQWTPPFEVANGVQHATLRYPTWNPVLVQVPHGPLLLFYKAGPTPSSWWGMLTTSDDGGVTWSTPRRLPEGIDGPVKNKPIWLNDGSLLCGSSTESDGWRVHFERTRDLGATWERTPAVNDGKAIMAIQPTILRHLDGRLQALCRTAKKGRMAEIWSSDEGRTWGEMKLGSLPNPNAGFDGVTLRDGRLLLVYNHSTGETGGRSKVNVAVSRHGKEWKAALRLEDGIAFDGRRASGAYPAVIQTRDGLVHTVYTWKRERIQHVVIDPKKLSLRDMPDGQWPTDLTEVPEHSGPSLRADLMEQPGVVSAEFVFTEAPFRNSHASTVAETQDAIVAAYFAGHREGHPSVGIWLSRKVGKGRDDKWSAPVEVANGHQPSGERFPSWNPVLYQPPTGPLLLFYKVGPSPRTWWGLLRTSDDQGLSWSSPQRLPDDFCGPVRAKPVLLDDGRLLCGASTEHTGWRAHMEWTPDLGKTWVQTAALNDGKSFPAIQPTILTFPDDSLSILCRSNDHLLQSWSTDKGRTWTPLERSMLPNPSAGTDVVTLRDGRQLLVYNHSTRKTGGRSFLNVAVSDDGKIWKAALKLEDGTTVTGGKASGSYPAAIQASSGLVHITYSWRYLTINHVVIDPERLQLRDMPDGQWVD